VRRQAAPRWVDDKRNSLCCSCCWDGLDFSTWYTDRLRDWPLYLHVSGKAGTDWEGTFHRVYPRKRKDCTVRLGMENGRLRWIYDKPIEPAP
jgi:hypothetical protein